MLDIEFDLSGIKKACDAGQNVLTQTAESAAVRAAQEGLQESRDKQRFQNRTHNLRNKAEARPVRSSRDEAVVDIVWPVPYASYVDKGTEKADGTQRTPAFAFAGDAALKAERVLLRESESGAAELEAVLNHNF